MERLERINRATLNLFKSVYNESDKASITEENNIEAVSKGIIFVDSFFGANEIENDKIVKLTIQMYGKRLFNLNNSFHKDWKTVELIDPRLHYLQQVLHYLSTYGLERLGVAYNTKNVYIPDEEITIPKDMKPINFILIRKIDKDEILKRVNTLLTSGVALSQEQIDDILVLINSLELQIDFDYIKNKEARAAIWLDLLDKPFITVDEFLRVLTYKVSGSTLLLRSYRNHRHIKSYLAYNTRLQTQIQSLLVSYINQVGIEYVASQFLRNKMLFLAFKCEPTKKIINKIRRLADKYHKAQENKTLNVDDIINANIWQLVKYWNYCTSKLKPTNDKLYQIRNGLNYLKTDVNNEVINVNQYKYFMNMIRERLVYELDHLRDKLIYIPDYIDYKVPSSLKRICQGIPEGTILKFPDVDHYTVGIHWTNVLVNDKEIRIDLDLHANSVDHQIGWYSSYKNEEIMYSGDMTDAPIAKGGASEAILIKTDDPYIVTLNDYTQYNNVPYQFVFDFGLDNLKSNKEHFGNIFTSNVRTLNTTLNNDHSTKTLGLAMKDRFYFTNSSIFDGPVTRNTDLLKKLLAYYEETQNNNLSVADLLSEIGAHVINDMSMIPEDRELDFDLSLEAITEDTFVQMFTKPEQN